MHSECPAFTVIKMTDIGIKQAIEEMVEAILNALERLQ
jgi:hypothetical protein